MAITEETTGITCYECGEDYPDEDECPTHGDANVAAIRITPCAWGSECEDENHHFGLNCHTIEI